MLWKAAYKNRFDTVRFLTEHGERKSSHFLEMG